MKTKLFYGWWIVAATNIICMFGYGTWLYSFGVFFKPMSEEFGWTRAMTSGAYALRSVEGGVASPVVGWAVDKYGARLLVIIGAVVAGGAFCLMPLIKSLMGFYLVYGILLSAGMSAMLYLPAWTVIAQWFRRRLSLALAITLWAFVTEEEILALEREAFLSLCGEKKTQDRIMYLLNTGKPLRN